MTVKTGSAWAGSFVTLDATGAKSASEDAAGVLYVDGVADDATVTITGTNPYKWSVTLPALTAGQRVDMYITATIATIATAGFVASEQADTSILSDGVVVNSGTVTTLTNLPAAPTDWLTADAVKADAVTKIQSGLATPTNITAGTITTATNLTNLPSIPANWLTGTGVDASAVTKLQANLALEATLTAIKGAGWSTETLAAIDVLIDAIKAKTDLIPATPAVADEYDAALAAIQADLDNPAQYKADVSGLATAAALTTVDTNVDSVLADTNEIQAELADGGRTDLLIDSIVDATTATGVLLKDNAIEAIFNDFVVTGTYTFAQLIKIMASALAGKLSGGGTTTLTFRGVDDTSDVIVTTVDANKNRTNVVITV